MGPHSSSACLRNDFPHVWPRQSFIILRRLYLGSCILHVCMHDLAFIKWFPNGSGYTQNLQKCLEDALTLVYLSMAVGVKGLLSYSSEGHSFWIWTELKLKSPCWGLLGIWLSFWGLLLPLQRGWQWQRRQMKDLTLCGMEQVLVDHLSFPSFSPSSHPCLSLLGVASLTLASDAVFSYTLLLTHSLDASFALIWGGGGGDSSSRSCCHLHCTNCPSPT